MRILNIIQCTNLAGMEQASLRLMQALQRLGHPCKLLSLNPIGELGGLLEKSGIAAVGLNYRGPAGLWSWRSYRRALADEAGRTDAFLMTGHNLMAMIGLGRFCRGRRVLAQHFHHTGVKSGLVWKLIYAVANRRFDAITFPCDFIRQEAEQLFPPIMAKAHTIRCPVGTVAPTTPEQRLAARTALGLPVCAPIVGNAGWLIPRKRWDVFLETAQLIKKMIPEAVFVVAGDGPLRMELKELSARLGLTQSVRWLGWCAGMADFYRSIDVLLFNTDWDAFPVTPQEAMSYGVPVVASAINSGLKELFDQFAPGKLFADHDIRVLAAEAVAILQNTSLAQQLGSTGRDGMARLGSPIAIARQYLALLGSQSK